ncbi:MAG: ArsA family ATPase [Acidimicrobiales bacterium]
MDPAAFCSFTRLVIVAGKGGVGKTTVVAALARMAAGAGLSALVIDVEGRNGLAEMFGAGPLDYHETTLLAAGGRADAEAGPSGGEGGTEAADGGGGGEIRARTLTPDDALLEYLVDHGLRRISRRLVSSGVLDVVATAVPGIRDILILGKVKQLERAGAADLIVVDAPAAGHAVRFLTSAGGLADAARVGPLRSQAEEVLELLTDGKRCQVILVTLPEETPVNEVTETAHALSERVGVRLGPVVVNGLYPVLEGLDADPADPAGRAGVALPPGDAEALRAAAAFRAARQELQAEQVARLSESLALPQLHLPYLFETGIGRAEIDLLAGALAQAVAAL